jgi:hypothetical protein
VGPLIHRLAGASVAWLAFGCAHVPWADDPSAEPPKVCAAARPGPNRAREQEPGTPVARAQTFYCRGLYAPAATLLTQEVIERQDATPPERAAALRWLVYIHRRFPGWEWIVNVIGQIGAGDLDLPQLADLHDELYLLAGRDALRREEYSEALALLRTIPASSPHHGRATLVEGAVDVQTGAPERALVAFTEALRIASADRDKKHARDRELAALSVARTQYALRQFDLASKSYESLPASSEYWIAAAIEGAWTRVQMKDLPRALVLLQSLEARSREVPPDTMAEAMVLEANIALQNNKYRDAEAIIGRFDAVYPELFAQAHRLAAYEPQALFDLGFSVRAGGSLSPPLGAERTLLLLADIPVARRFDELDEISREERALVSPYADEEARLDLTERRDAAEREAGDLFLRRLQEVVDHLAERIKQANRIEYDALGMERAALQRLW